MCSTAWNPVLLHRTQKLLYLMASQFFSLLASQPCKYINMYITCQVTWSHPMLLLPQHPMLQDSI